MAGGWGPHSRAPPARRRRDVLAAASPPVPALGTARHRALQALNATPSDRLCGVGVPQALHRAKARLEAATESPCLSLRVCATRDCGRQTGGCNFLTMSKTHVTHGGELPAILIPSCSRSENSGHPRGQSHAFASHPPRTPSPTGLPGPCDSQMPAPHSHPCSALANKWCLPRVKRSLEALGHVCSAPHGFSEKPLLHQARATSPHAARQLRPQFCFLAVNPHRYSPK